MRLSMKLPFICLCFTALFLPLTPCLAQTPADLTLSQADSMPPWIVPVLRLVSATHVEPTTGVVLSDSGLVLVPADFASMGDEIIVLDGGTDIIRNGRPAKILQRFSGEGLQVLSVQALHRQSAGFSPDPLTDGGEVRLAAFPPAEMIAEGAPPLDIPVTLSIPVESGKPAISAQNPLPNVTGPLLDECGQLAGYSSANGVQSMSTSESPGYQWKENLIRLMNEMQLEPRIADCRPAAAPGNEAALPEDEPGPEPGDAVEVDEPGPEPEESPEAVNQDDPETAESSAEEDATGETATDEPAEQADNPQNEGGLLDLETLPPHEDKIPVDDSATPALSDSSAIEEKEKPAWPWLLAALLLIASGIVLHRIRASKSEEPVEESAQSPAAEWVSDGSDDEDSSDSAPGFDSCLVLSGQLTDGRPVDARCNVSSMAINLLVGRGNADLIIDSPAVSRHHASINGTADSLTISDLGSSNGTSINGIPCLEGETMYINPGDTIILGNVRIHYEVIPASATLAPVQE